jgi:signal transduction histidine kinase
MTGKTIPPYELVFFTKNKEKRIGRIRATPLYDDEGNVIGDLAMVSDITEMKTLEEKITEQEKMAALGRVAAVVSHELNTPLANIKLTAEYLSSQLPHKYLKEIKTIKKEVKLASTVIKKVLGFSHVDNFEQKRINLPQIIQGSLDIVHTHFDIPSHLFSLDIPRSLYIPGDEYQLREAFVNIIKNAVEALKTTNNDSTISITLKQHNHSAILTVSDKGIGMDKDLQNIVNKPFITTKPPSEGTGLGLYITQYIISQHGGQMSFSSQKNQGTNVIITLPCSPKTKNN